MRANGKYASMYQLQASLYEKDSNEATINETTSKMNVEKDDKVDKGGGTMRKNNKNNDVVFKKTVSM